MRIVVALVLILVALYAYATFLRRTSMFYPDRNPLGEWDTRRFAVVPEDVQFKTRDGVDLHGWLFHASTPNGPLMVWFHGNAGNITGRAPMAFELARRGISVLLFDYCGYGKSEGVPTENALYDDAEAAYAFASQRSPQIVVYGESLGGPYAAWIAKHHPVKCVVIENSFPSLRDLGNAIYFPFGWFAPSAMNTARWLNDANVPVLVMHGRRDQVIPFRLGVALYERLRVPKEILISDAAGHCEIPTVEGSKYYDTVVKFIQTQR